MIPHLMPILASLAFLVGSGDSSEQPNCPMVYQDVKRPINESSFEYLCPGGDKNISEYILYGYLGSFNPEYNGVSTLIAGAMPLAVEQVNKDPKLLPGYNLCFMNGDTGVPDTADAMRRMTEMKDSGVDAFVGLEHSCVSEAFLAAAWDTPVISYKCADVKVSNKTLFPTFGRTLTPSSKVSKSLIATLKHFNWRKIVIVSENTTSDYPQIEEAFRNELAALEGLPEDPMIEVTETYHVPGDYMYKDKGILENIIDQSRDLTRIYVVLSNIDTLSDFAHLVQSKGMNEAGEYMILSVEKDEVYDQTSYKDFCSRVATPLGTDDNWIEDEEQKACRSLMILAPNYPRYDEFAQKVLQKNRGPPFRIPYYDPIPYRVPIYAGLAYDAVMLLATGMTKVMEKNLTCNSTDQPFDPKNGSLVIEMLSTLTYTSILGNQLEQIDKNGDANGSYTLLSFQSQMDRSMRRVATFIPRPDCASSKDSNAKKLCVHDLKFLPGMSIDWITSQPVDEPKCGFQNEKCGLRWEVVTAIVCICSLMTVALAFMIRHYWYEQKLACLLWKVDSKEIIMSRTSSEYTLNNLRSTINGIDLARIASYHPASHYASSLEVEGVPLTSGPGFYKGNVVHVKKVDKKSVDLTREIRKELIH